MDEKLMLQRKNQQHLITIKSLKSQIWGLKSSNKQYKNFIFGGTCPCCKKTYKHFSRHMKKKHKDYV